MSDNGNEVSAQARYSTSSNVRGLPHQKYAPVEITQRERSIPPSRSTTRRSSPNEFSGHSHSLPRYVEIPHRSTSAKACSPPQREYVSSDQPHKRKADLPYLPPVLGGYFSNAALVSPIGLAYELNSLSRPSSNYSSTTRPPTSHSSSSPKDSQWTLPRDTFRYAYSSSAQLPQSPYATNERPRTLTKGMVTRVLHDMNCNAADTPTPTNFLPPKMETSRLAFGNREIFVSSIHSPPPPVFRRTASKEKRCDSGSGFNASPERVNMYSNSPGGSYAVNFSGSTKTTGSSCLSPFASSALPTQSSDVSVRRKQSVNVYLFNNPSRQNERSVLDEQPVRGPIRQSVSFALNELDTVSSDKNVQTVDTSQNRDEPRQLLLTKKPVGTRDVPVQTTVDEYVDSWKREVPTGNPREHLRREENEKNTMKTVSFIDFVPFDLKFKQ